MSCQLPASVLQRQRGLLRQIARRQWILECASLLALAAAGCRRSHERGSARASTATIACRYGIQALNPSYDEEAKFLLFLPLVAEGDTGELEARLAQRWEHSPDFREWTCHLRTDVRWHDGVPVTARDVKFTIDLLPDFDDVAASAIESIVIDDHTVRIRYAGSADVLPTWQVYYPKHRLEHLDPKTIFDWEFWTHPVGNGPYRFVRYIPETMMEFKANADSFRRPRIERLVLKFAGASGLTELLSGNVDAITDVNAAEIPKLAGDRRFHVYYGPGTLVAGPSSGEPITRSFWIPESASP